MSGDSGLRILVNPTGLDADIGAHFLSRCFGTHWTEAMYRWYMQRPFGGEVPDRIMLLDGERVVAGCGLAYRLLRTPDGTVHPVSVIVSAGTLPAERGRGYFARLSQAAVTRSAQRGCTAMLAFVTVDNASARVLRRLGATEVASTYIASRGRLRVPVAGILRVRPAVVTGRWPAGAGARLAGPPPRSVFHYPDMSAWASQMVKRPHPVHSLRVGATCRALIECVDRTDRLQWLDGDPRERFAAIRAIAAHAQQHQRLFFMYSTRGDDPEAARRLGLVTRPGYLMALATEARHEPTVHSWRALSWDVQSGDRM
jgi:ribosomal protein S18 acetylase RimI-like enzyme